MSFPAMYTFSATDGMPAGGNFTLTAPLPDGSWLVQPWSRPLVRITNTGIIPLRHDSSSSTGALRTIKGSHEWFIQYEWGLVKRSGDTIFSQPAYQKGNGIGWACKVGRYLVCTVRIGDQDFLYRFDGEQWQPLPLPDDERTKAGPVSMALVLEDKVRVLAYNSLKKVCKVFELDDQTWQLQLVCGLTIPSGAGVFKFVPPDTLLVSFKGGYYSLTNGKLYRQPWQTTMPGGIVLRVPAASNYSTIALEESRKHLTVGTTDRIQAVAEHKSWPTYLIGTSGGLHKVFPYIRYFPQVYEGVHSQATHSLMQMDNGELYAGSYGGHLSAISAVGIIPVRGFSAPVLPGGVGFKNSLYFFTEAMASFWHKNVAGRPKGHANAGYAIAGFYVKPSSNGKQLFLGLSGNKGIGIVNLTNGELGSKPWRFADSTKGVRLLNVLTIAEDPLGRLWFGRTSEGWGVYDPKTDKGITYRIAEGQTNFGAMASAVDNNGTVWLGGRQGLYYADGLKPALAKPSDVNQLRHPLLSEGTDINAIKLWKNFLVIGIGKRLLLLDLVDFRQHYLAINTGKRWARIRYLSPQEFNLNANVEQNCLLVDNRDSSIWLATNNLVYQIDMAARLKLPAYSAKPIVQVIAGADTQIVKPDKPISLPPSSNSLQISFRYETPDNLPRLAQVAFQAEGDSLRWTEPGTTNQITALNRQTGQYLLHIRLFEFDGSVSEFVYPITIRRFLWQQWWFWLLLSLAVGGMVFYAYYLHKQKQLAEANAARIAAEAEALRAEQQRQLTAMQVKSLSTQFRPHFILNALNTVGAQLYDKPDVDAVLGQLGDSIGIIFRNAQAGSIAHPLAQEWQLVHSVINIKQMEMRHSVQVHWQVAEHLFADTHYQVPMGLLQIPVENALVHGLRNKEDGARNLWISAAEQPQEALLSITITDDGIGRKAAAALGNHRSNGVGSRNLQAILHLLNAHNPIPMTMTVVDLPLTENGMPCGTRVIVNIPQHYSYAYEQLKPNSTALPGS